MEARRQVQLMGIAGFGLLCVPLVRLAGSYQISPPLPEVASPPGTGFRQRPFDAALREARYWHGEARERVDREREAQAAWDPAAERGPDLEEWRQQMAGDRGGSLRRARAALQRAAALAETPHDQGRVEALRALLACETGHHAVELRHARRTAALAPRSRWSLLWLRRAARCNGLKSLERQVETALMELKPPMQGSGHGSGQLDHPPESSGP